MGCFIFQRFNARCVMRSFWIGCLLVCGEAVSITDLWPFESHSHQRLLSSTLQIVHRSLGQ